MNNLTKMKILKPAHDVFEAFADPSKIKNFWWSSSSERWEQGKAITLTYDEYDAQLEIKIAEVDPDKKIVFLWGAPGAENVVTISLKELDSSTTIIEVNEDGFKSDDPELLYKMIDNKEGWVYMLTCLKGYLEHGINTLRGGLVKD
ncbi:hypothetical protein AN964_03175 [Heyndrickxia shackletonii]|uniref:Activator of Hsp90 ATPase homologue 1/2-like C-terminal domain-containing protein n=1 Tax=Heyndrickxia shackletonii TaxID=157838 RepID=A0A0Q3WPG4_9BACI|nr:SRPBCC family protein [Heyndrickxia shackletonii]KQL52629.1 hypothetical protein AN964_03175 [Heyndrickxia shackletonii]MBB2482663.1 SRPBCC domain-containing protein [Bacillus sp. APMAM]NEZ00166.1 hypothetical protein [Heyndrickxia shackletonii]RTZ53939.1 hypothetical protein EKO25_20815 [Bacillus sp. SAJ1]